MPPSIVNKYNLHLPPYPGTAMCVRIGKPPQVDIAALRENYISPEFVEENVEADPIRQVNTRSLSFNETSIFLCCLLLTYILYNEITTFVYSKKVLC